MGIYETALEMGRGNGQRILHLHGALPWAAGGARGDAGRVVMNNDTQTALLSLRQSIARVKDLLREEPDAMCALDTHAQIVGARMDIANLETFIRMERERDGRVVFGRVYQ